MVMKLDEQLVKIAKEVERRRAVLQVNGARLREAAAGGTVDFGGLNTLYGVGEVAALVHVAARLEGRLSERIDIAWEQTRGGR
jgi:hypothetical protein